MVCISTHVYDAHMHVHINIYVWYVYKYKNYNRHVCIYVLLHSTNCREKQIDRQTDRQRWISTPTINSAYLYSLDWRGSFTSYFILSFEFDTKAYVDFVIKNHKMLGNNTAQY